jgi:hypothetical protein
MKPLPSVLVLPVVVLALLAGCADDGEPLPAPLAGPSWVPVADGPLSPRFDATAVWSGREVLVFGGYSHAGCASPDMACVPTPAPSMRDGAAYDPAANSWRPIAAAPTPIRRAQTAVVEDTVYVLAAPDFGAPNRYLETETPDVEYAFTAYHVTEDRWEDLPDPPKGSRVSLLAAVGGRAIAYRRDISDDYDDDGSPADSHDYAWDAAAAAWREVPSDPANPLSNRWLADVGGAGILTGRYYPHADDEGLDEAAVRMARAERMARIGYRRLDPQRLTWSGRTQDVTPAVVPDGMPRYGLNHAAPWWSVGGGLVTVPPVLEHRSAEGWVLDSDLRVSQLRPRPPLVAEPLEGFGWAATAGGGYAVAGRYALQVAKREWREIPVEPGLRGLRGVSAVWAGDGLFAWGGGPDAEAQAKPDPAATPPAPRDTGWIWRPDWSAPTPTPTPTPTPPTPTPR